MNKRVIKIAIMFMICFVLFLTGCSSNRNSENAKMDMSSAVDSNQSTREEKSSSSFSGESDRVDQTVQAPLEVPNQMVIYQADLHLRVKKFEQTLQSLEEKVEKYGGYIAQSSVIKEGKEQINGNIKIRIPQKHFQAFLHDAEAQAAEVLQRDITGTDVTEEYVDLESRLKSKRVVEERLLSFMSTAAKTEDLLKISADLAKVQEEIEALEGKRKFLENQTSLSTISITLYEHKVIVPAIDKDNLNTWDKTKKQFVKSTNMLLGALSGLVVFIVGNLPILGILAITGFLLFLYLKKRMKKNGGE